MVFKSSFKKFQRCFWQVLRVFEINAKGISEKFQRCFKGVLRKFQGHSKNGFRRFMEVSRVFQG